LAGHPAGMPPPASLKRPSHVRVADWACVVQLRARRRTVALPPGATARGRKRRLVIASVVHAIRRRAALEAAPISPAAATAPTSNTRRTKKRRRITQNSLEQRLGCRLVTRCLFCCT